jgi:hypothetical protein
MWDGIERTLSDQETEVRNEPMHKLPNIKPDKIEQQIIQVVSEVTDQTEMIDDRSHFTRIIRKWSSKEDEKRDDAIKEMWTKEIVQRVSTLGRRFGYRSESAHRGMGFRGGWMFDVIWRDLNTGGDWHTTTSVPLALACDWYVSGIGFPTTEALDKLLVTRAERRVLIYQKRYGGNEFGQSVSYVDQCEITEPGDRYLFLCYDMHQKKLFSQVYRALKRVSLQ